MKHTPLFEVHERLGAKIVEFAGYGMPVSYEGVLKEHQAVREGCGLFDVSHMGEVRVHGAGALAFLQKLTTNNVAVLNPGQGQYTSMLRPTGGMIDDLILYRVAEDEYFLCINASNREKDFAWIAENARSAADVTVADESEHWAQIAVQGPTSQAVLAALLEGNLAAAAFHRLPYMGIMRVDVAGGQIYVARTGYTGEHGYEVYTPPKAAVAIWEGLLTSPKHRVMPIGLGARDTLRLEACYLLYGSDMDESVTPLEAGISWATKIGAKDFIGKEALVAMKAKGIPRVNIAFKMTEPGIPRHDMALVTRSGAVIGRVTSGSVLPTVGGAGGMALIEPQYSVPGTEIFVDVRGKRKLAEVAKKPLYTAKVKD